MELLREIHDKDIGVESSPATVYALRRAARAILVDGTSFAVLHVRKHGYYKTAGGGIEEGEDIKTALEREILEETGCVARVTGDLGMTLEYRDQYGLLQISYCYLAEVLKRGTPEFTKKEQADGFALEWMTFDDAVTCSASTPAEYSHKFMAFRDHILFQRARELLQRA